MAGCEYIKSIDRIGLKVVLNNLRKLKTCEEVIKDLQKSLIFKDRVPLNYFDNVQKIKQIFKFQTVYNPFT
jgi:hypothetical protein